VALYRMFAPNVTDHFYTIDENEVNEALGLGYIFDTDTHIAGYVYPNSICGASPIYRLYSGGLTDHFYTMSYSESLSASGSGYSIEGIVGFALLPSVDGAAQTSTASASPLFLPALAASETSVSAIPAFTTNPDAGSSSTPGGAAPTSRTGTSGSSSHEAMARAGPALGFVVLILIWSSL